MNKLRNRTPILLLVYLLLTLVFVHSRVAWADESPWWDGFGNIYLGINGSVRSMVPMPGVDGGVVVGGEFSQAADRATINVAFWDGDAWHPMDTTDGSVPSSQGLPGFVRALSLYQGTVIAGGRFTDRADVAAWHTDRWDPVGGISGQVNALSTYQDELIATGEFRRSSGDEIHHVARWDGSDWHLLGSGFPYQGTEGVGRAMTVHEGRLAMAATIRIALWDGSEWTKLHPYSLVGETPGIHALASFQGSLIIGGGIRIGGSRIGPDIYYIVAWDGNYYSQLGGGLNGPVRAMAVDGDKLYVSGAFTMAGETEVSNLAVWDGVSWSALGMGFDAPVTAILPQAEALYVGGDFIWIGDLHVNRWVVWKEGQWIRPPAVGGMNGAVSTLLPHEDRLLVGGEFTHAGGIPVNFVAAWDGHTWATLENGVNDRVWALAEYNGDLIAGGAFTEASDRPVSRIARWDGEVWLPLGGGMDLPVYSLLSHDGHLYAGGAFTQAGGSAIEHIARWDGSDWTSVGGGVDDWVLDLEEFQGELIAGGFFRNAGGNTANRVAAWDGLGWRGMDTQFRDWESVGVLEVFRGDLVIGGNFQRVAGNYSPQIARWDGQNWFPLGGALNGQVMSLHAYNSSLFVGGQFVRSEELELGRLVRWNGRWNTLEGGAPGGWPGAHVSALAVYGGHLYTGGSFGSTSSAHSHYIARWNGLNDIVPVTLLFFKGFRVGSEVHLQWETGGNASDLAGFHVFRESPGQERQRISKTLLSGSKYYEFHDPQSPSASVNYWLLEVTRVGEEHWHGPRTVPEAIPSRPLLLTQNNPNPVRSGTEISFQVPQSGRVKLSIFDVSGREIAVPLSQWVSLGTTKIRWDGKDSAGGPVPAGVYFYRLQTSSGTLARKLLVVR